MTCMYCKAAVDAPVYAGTCMACTASLMAPMTDSVILRRIQIERMDHGDAVADRLRAAIDAVRKGK